MAAVWKIRDKRPKGAKQSGKANQKRLADRSLCRDMRGWPRRSAGSYRGDDRDAPGVGLRRGSTPRAGERAQTGQQRFALALVLL